MRPPWVYQMTAFFLLSAAVVAIIIDAQYSYRWVQVHISLSQDVAKGFCYVLSILSSSFGALITNRSSWSIIAAHNASIDDPENEMEALTEWLGVAVSAGFMLLFVGAVYAVNIISNLAETGNLFAAIMICLASDACLALVNPIWYMAIKARSVAKKFNTRAGARDRSFPRRKASKVEVVDD